MDESAILSAFPFDKPREGQLDCMKKVLDAFLGTNKKFAIIEGPTGCGKSVIGHTISQFFDGAYYLTSSKLLQDQLINDFGRAPSKSGYNTSDLKGRNAYPCSYWDTIKLTKDPVQPSPPKPGNKVDCSAGACKIRGESKCAVCFPTGKPTLCAYYQALETAQNAHTAVMNFSSFLFQKTFTKQFGRRPLLIIDECHNIESQLMSFVSLSLNDALFAPDVKFPNFANAQQYSEWLRKSPVESIIKQKIKLAQFARQIKDADHWTNQLYKYETFINADSNEWISSFKEIKGGISRIIELKPIFVREYAKKYIFDIADKVLLMSATVLAPNQMCESLGIDKTDVFAIRMKSRFPVKNRPIFIQDVGSMSYKSKNDTLPKLADKVTEICQKYKGVRGMIHTHNFEIADTLKLYCPRDVSKRFRYQNDYESKNNMLDDHALIEDSIIIAPAMHEGLDLADDLARFQIICKVPYPSFKDNPQLEARMKMSQGYYDWLTSLKLVQSYGRAVRSETDFADTYIIDSDIHWFIEKAGKILPTWFTEAIIRK